MSNALAGDITVITTADVNTARVIKIFFTRAALCIQHVCTRLCRSRALWLDAHESLLLVFGSVESDRPWRGNRPGGPNASLGLRLYPGVSYPAGGVGSATILRTGQ
jgi:hypothetical protein